MKMFIFAVMLLTNAYSMCNDFSINSEECLHEETTYVPSFSNGKTINVNDGVCRPYKYGLYKEVIEGEQQGINISLQFKHGGSAEKLKTFVMLKKKQLLKYNE